MNEERLEALIEQWEPFGCEVVRVIDSEEGQVERDVKYDGAVYSLFRYFEIGMVMDADSASVRTVVSVDLQDVDADRVIQHLAERL